MMDSSRRLIETDEMKPQARNALRKFIGEIDRWKAFAEDRNTRSGRFYRIANEVPTVLMIGIVVMVIVRPF